MIQVYTGNGKGKTTAALGLAVRAAGAGLKVYVGQFAKGRECSEHKTLKRIKNIKLELFGGPCFITGKPSFRDRALAREAMRRINQVVDCGSYQVIILDEVNVALKLKLVSLKEVLDLVRRLPVATELVLTGRDAPRKLIEKADLVSHIREVKHYYRRGVKARKGIEL